MLKKMMSPDKEVDSDGLGHLREASDHEMGEGTTHGRGRSDPERIMYMGFELRDGLDWTVHQYSRSDGLEAIMCHVIGVSRFARFLARLARYCGH